MNRKTFIQQSATLLALASSYQFAKAADAFSQQPNKELDHFFTEVHHFSKNYLNKGLNDFEWRTKMNEAYITYFSKNNISDLISYFDFHKIQHEINFSSKGRGRLLLETPLSFSEENVKLKTQLIGIKRGYAIPPHIHENMASASLIISGRMLVSHYNRLATHKKYVVVEKDSEYYQEAASWSIVSPTKNNLHWFKAIDTDAYMLNINIEGLNEQKAKPGIRVDITQSKQHKNKYKATIISEEEAQQKYGKL